MKFKPVQEFRQYKAKGFDYIIEADKCLLCEDNPRAFGRHAEDRKKATVDQYTNDYQCGFIGNTPYKKICEIFRIKHQ
jgi:hypothetical protein